MALLLRMYGGLFSDFVPISEKALARRLYYEPQQIVNMLLHIDALGAIMYRPRHTRPQIVFTSPRIDANNLYLTESNYNQLKQHATERIEAIRHYVLSDQACRSQMLLDYFGETGSLPCGHCDYCLQHKKTESDHIKSLRDRLLLLLKEKPCRAEELIDLVGDIDEEKVRQQLRELVDQHLVSIDSMLRFSLRDTQEA